MKFFGKYSINVLYPNTKPYLPSVSRVVDNIAHDSVNVF